MLPTHPLATTERSAKALEYWTQNPVEAVKAWFSVTPEDYQGDIVNSLLKPGPNKQARVAAKSAHGVGKTTAEAWCGWVFLMTRMLSRTVATAPTSHQLHDILWPEFAKWHSRMPKEIASLWEISATHIRNKEHPLSWFAAARTSNKQENMQGFHEDHVLVICEEASGIPPGIFEVIEGILSNAGEKNQEALLLLVGNPTQTAGEFYNAFNKHKDLYHRFTITGDETTKPDRGAGKFYVSKRVTQKYRDNMSAKYGADGMVYDVRVRGIFPLMADDVVIPLEWAERATHKALPHFDEFADGITLVMDVARFGGDKTTLAVFRKGSCLSLDWWPKTSGTRCVDIMTEAYFHGSFGVGTTPVVRVIVDEPGVGGPIIDQMIRQDIPATPYNGGLGMKSGGDPEEDVRMFANRRSRDWWNLRRKLELGLMTLPNMEDLCNELASVKFDYMNEKIKVETKKEMRERLGDDASPDLADTIVMGTAPFVGVSNQHDLDWFAGLEDHVSHGKDRPTANMDF